MDNIYWSVSLSSRRGENGEKGAESYMIIWRKIQLTIKLFLYFYIKSQLKDIFKADNNLNTRQYDQYEQNSKNVYYGCFMYY